ncbi:MAG: redox-sensing transcriptional repressor Rex [bacterium]|uniref:Redox-sensing transcriptional repressor Rex n=1 Tax=Candidatus Methylomirabilis tolerans TaxID=3123416 RepID=A0AAJ1AIS2_9BACT|nr:redox-sensing transcriptional repressor Rex [Candidatus Methylomirabilis sp.]
MKAIKISEKTVTRLSIYLRCIEELENEGMASVSSTQLADRFGLNSAQVRKDLAYFGQFGIRGLGYYITPLRHSLEEILGLKRAWEVALVGLGNLGSALIAYKGFQEKGFKIAVVFDRDPAKIGRRVEGIPVMDMGSIVSVIRKRKIKIGILAVPAVGAQAVFDALVKGGVIAVLNFAPTQLTGPDSVKIQNVDLSALLKTLSYHIAQAERPV